MIRSRSWVLVVIVFSQFACTSLWFAGNAVMPDLIEAFNFALSDLGYITSSVQFGFIVGTLSYAFLTLSDRFSPSKVFFFSALAAGAANLGLIIEGQSELTVLLLRFMCGFFLAGIYPVGMKIASDYFHEGLGKALGFLVGALVIGTAFPHLLKSLNLSLPWRFIFVITSAMSFIGGLLILFLVADGPHRKFSKTPDLSAFFKVFKNRRFRLAAFGYFGHMWELYAFWAFVPVLLLSYQQLHTEIKWSTSMLSFYTIAIGGLACVASGYFSQKYGSKKAAYFALLGSCICCILSPLAFYLPSVVLIIFLLFWGMLVVADSPQFSTLVAQNAPAASRGTALTIVNCLGFSITILSIQLLSMLLEHIEPTYIYVFLAVGPVLGLLAMRRFDQKVS
ncbi:MFS family permease [Catalinimonas alkaloidigena]|uniref:MFS transporter n=1 Tax=Catalinimonas alkaloidigena TaxID=1075417 RepID=UPI002405328A|nr:MFS transporter [Catalinimonas alkaloidigena]MDF9798750.1 MFS family permease [Catalinimonas alkaloidigena]